MRWLLLFGALTCAASACGGSPAATASTPSPAPTAAPEEGGTDSTPAPISAADCALMSDHMVNVRVDEMRQQDPASVPDADQQEAIRDRLRDEFVKECVSEGIPREVFECWLKGTTTRELGRCAGSEEPGAPPTTVDDRNLQPQ